ncbi:MAG: DsbA family protein [Candidatus Rokubacteria bacterium]|nr:DsbA family protein [Candidatus Rokubacteria bacterium]
MRLRRLREELGPALVIESRAFPLRPTPDPSVRFKGTYREEGWRRCAQMAAADGITFTPWPHEVFASWSLPALEAAKCVANQGESLAERVHLGLYEAFFTHSRNIADREEVARIVAETGADMARFTADYASGLGREAVVGDYEAALADGVRAIPTVVIAETGRAVTGLADLATYRAAVSEAAG